MRGWVRLTVSVCKKTTTLDGTLAKNPFVVDTSEADVVDEADRGQEYLLQLPTAGDLEYNADIRNSGGRGGGFVGRGCGRTVPK